MNCITCLTILCLVARFATAIGPALGAACMASVEMFNYGCDNSKGINYTCSCVNPVYMGSVLYCIGNHAQTYTIEQEARTTVNNVCSPASHKVLSSMDFDVVYVNASKYIHSTELGDKMVRVLPFRIPPEVLYRHLEASLVLMHNTDQTKYLR